MQENINTFTQQTVRAYSKNNQNAAKLKHASSRPSPMREQVSDGFERGKG